MKKEKLRVGIAGFGVVGKRRRYFIDQHPNMQTVAVCDIKFEDCGVMSDGVKCFQNYHQLLEVPLDVLFVCAPNFLAPLITIEGLKRNLHVFCEKPPGRTVKDIEEVIKVEKQHPGLLLKYGFNHRYHASVREALKIIKSGELGGIINMRGIYGKSKIIPFSGGWRAERKYSGGGILLDQGIHIVDLMRLFCGEFVDVKSFVSNRFWKHDVEDNVYALMRDEQGRVAILHSSATQWQHQFSLDISLDNGFIVLWGILSDSKSYGEEELVVGRRDEAHTGSMREEVTRYIEDNSWRDEVNEFADAILNENSIDNGNSSDALIAMKMVYRIYFNDPEWREKFNIEFVE